MAGLGLAVVRDYAAYAKHTADAVTPAQRVYGEGISQNGRFLRDFLYQGFNADEEGHMTLDGVLDHVAGAGRGSFNYRFAQPSRDAQPTSSVYFPTVIFPFTDQPETDPWTGETRRLDRPSRRRQRLCPRSSSPTRRMSTGKGGLADPYRRGWQSGHANLGQCPHLPVHRVAALFRAIPAGER